MSNRGRPNPNSSGRWLSVGPTSIYCMSSRRWSKVSSTRPGVKCVFVFDCFQRVYLNYIEIRTYLYLIENGVFVFAFLQKKNVFDRSQPWAQPTTTSIQPRQLCTLAQLLLSSRRWATLSQPTYCCLGNKVLAISGMSHRNHTTSPSMYIFSCDQAALWLVQSVRLSVCLTHLFDYICSNHRTIMKFSGVITNDKCEVHAKGQGHRSKVKVTEANTQLSRFRTVTPVWIHIWIIRQISRSHD